ncbi:Intraflagellar transport protein like [Actinidia chinensis var. chinensis]|uniref:Intraflagellar transport protein like n=1 Tax=Actinidia chinensis var. chinensis TaxID=1590841 RepID=A0A2R6QJ97_ACTCC|nr:Intraflagellar transport protein like [Actinidia chinensis var. chinensis]
MGVKVATAYLHWSQSSVTHPPSSPQTLASTVSSLSLKRRSFSDGALMFRCIQRLDRSALFGTNICRSISLDQPKSRAKSIRQASSAGLNSFSDEEFSRKIQELAMKFQLCDDDEDTTKQTSESEIVSLTDSSDSSSFNFAESRRPFEPLEPPDWAAAANEIIPANIERRANIVELPLSLRIIKRKQKQWRGEVREAGESAYCSVKKAFSSMVFIIRELHSFSLQLREKLFYEDMQGILARVQNEMHASFVWLFQQVFSHTPTLMVYVMILLANYSVYSMSDVAAPPPPVAASVSVIEHQNHKQTKFDSSTIKSFSVSGGKMALIGGNNGGSGKFRPVSGGTDGGGRFDAAASLNTVVPDGVSTAREEESVSGQVSREEELMLWNSIVEESSRMQAAVRDEALDQETVGRFVSPVTAKIDADDYADYFKTELLYRTGLTHEPSNPLLLANYAQFLYLVAHDYDRAEEYFKRAVRVEPPDAEALSKYATFLWQARKDLWAAEETYLEAISADPNNSYYAANYAHFLWNTGGEDTCFPIDTNTNDA